MTLQICIKHLSNVLTDRSISEVPTISELKKECGISKGDKYFNLFLNEGEYFRWWDKDDGRTFNQYHFYQGNIGNGSCPERDKFYDSVLSKVPKDGHRSTIVFGGFTKKEIMNDYFVREGKGYSLLDIVKKFYGSERYKEIYDKIMNFAKNRMVYFEEDLSDDAKEMRQKN